VNSSGSSAKPSGILGLIIMADRSPRRHCVDDVFDFIAQSNLTVHRHLFPFPAALANRNFDHNVTAGLASINGPDYFSDHALNHSPAVPTEHNDGDFSALQILLVSKPVVRRQQYVEAGFFRCSKQVSIRKGFPSLLTCGLDSMVRKKRRDLNRRALIEENAHLLSK
jgi:hypothetical protein